MTCKSILEEVRHVSILDYHNSIPPPLPYSIGSKKVSTAVFDWQRQGQLMEGSEVGQFLSRIESPRCRGFHLIFDLSSMKKRTVLRGVDPDHYIRLFYCTSWYPLWLLFPDLDQVEVTGEDYSALARGSGEHGGWTSKHNAFLSFVQSSQNCSNIQVWWLGFEKKYLYRMITIQTLPNLFHKFSIIILHWLVFLWRWLWLSFPTPNARVRGPRASLVYGVPGQVWLWLIRY